VGHHDLVGGGTSDGRSALSRRRGEKKTLHNEMRITTDLKIHAKRDWTGEEQRRNAT